MQNIAEEFKTEIARKLVLYVQEIYNEVYYDLEDDFLKEDLKGYHDASMGYARDPLDHQIDELVLRGDDCYLRYLHAFIKIFAPQKLSRFYVLAKDAVMETFTEQTMHDNPVDIAENVRIRKSIIHEIHFLRNF